MDKITVSFFRCLSVASRTRRVPFPRMAGQPFHNMIIKTMDRTEFFACYRDGNGDIVAIDRDGFGVRI